MPFLQHSLKIKKYNKGDFFNAVYSSYRSFLRNAKKVTLSLFRIKQMIEYIYKIFHSMLLEYLDDFIHSVCSNYNFSEVYKLLVPKYNTVCIAISHT